jgi:uncharacterized protein YbcC (UPF0753/DUF2309 family)
LTGNSPDPAAGGLRDELRARLAHALDEAAHALPAQAPLARFVHHNTLHFLEGERFEDALGVAAERLGAETFLQESDYEQAVRSGRIQREDLVAALDEWLRVQRAHPRGRFRCIEADASFGAWRERRLAHPVPAVAGEAVDWLLSEGAWLERLLEDVDEDRAACFRACGDGSESAELRRLWTRCLELVRERSPERDRSAGPTRRLRDHVLARTGQDVDRFVNPYLIRFLSAYLDMGVAYWRMPDRDGIWTTFRRVAARATPPHWAPGLRAELEASSASAGDQVVDELVRREVTPNDVDAFVHAALQALPGFGGMVHQLETRPDLAPGRVPPVALLDVLAVRLVLDRLAATHELARASRWGSRAYTEPGHDPDDPRQLAFEVFVAARRAGRTAADLDRHRGAGLVAAVAAFDGRARREVFHLAYERRYRLQVLDGIAERRRSPAHEPVAPSCQVVFCIDEREESFRRHLEEVAPTVTTFGYAGHFDVLMQFEGLGAPRPVPLCPPVVTPRHRVREVPAVGHERTASRVLRRRSRLGRTGHARHVASRALVRGGFVALTGIASTIPLVARTLFPHLAATSTRRLRERLVPRLDTDLRIDREEGQGPGADGLFDGYSKQEQAELVAGALRTMGLDGRACRFSDLVVMMGHGSTSVNNPHASAYNCGACAGGSGGPNARAFARMANDPEVRRRMLALGLEIPPTTVFVGACHDTAGDSVSWFDLDRIGERAARDVRALRLVLDQVAMRNAHERSRRFPDAPQEMTPERALRHVQGRTVDLAQPRPEYCHATNAVAVVAPRALTRGLFLDRRAFLISYDQEADDAEGTFLERLLTTVGPVGAGINLEYYFSRVDPDRFGCGTKLPHNVVGLLGVMNGPCSDLRTGLHWQTVDLHEPMRLLLVLEAKLDVVLAIAGRNEVVQRLVGNRWVLVAVVDPETGAIRYLEPHGFVEHAPGSSGIVVKRVQRSREVYAGTAAHVPPACIDGPLDPSPASADRPEAVRATRRVHG